MNDFDFSLMRDRTGTRKKEAGFERVQRVPVENTVVKDRQREKSGGMNFEAVFAYVIGAFTFLFPLVFAPFLGSYVAGAKFLFLILMAVVLIMLVFVRVLIEKKFEMHKSKFDIPFYLFVLVGAVSYFFSTSPKSSLFGNYGSFAPSLLAMLSLAAIYFIVTSNIKSRKYTKLIKNSAIFSFLVVAILSIMQFFGLFLLPFDFAKNRNFNLIDSPLLLSVILTVFIIYIIYKLGREKNMAVKGLFALIGIVFSIAAFFVGGIAPIIMLIVALILMLFFGVLGDMKSGTPIFIGIVFVIFVISLMPMIKGIDAKDGFLRDFQLDVQNSWIISSSAIRDYPLLGSGQGTFPNDFTKYKSAAFNQTEYKDFRFNYPSSDYLLQLGEVGIIGFIAYITIHLFILGKFKTVHQIASSKDFSQFDLVASYIYLVAFSVGLLFVSLNIVGLFVFVLLLALFSIDQSKVDNVGYARHSMYEEQPSFSDGIRLDSQSIPKIFVGIVMLALLGFNTFVFVNFVRGDLAFRKARDYVANNEIVKGYDEYRVAISANTYYDIYRREYALVNVALAEGLALDEDGKLREDLSEEEQTQIATLYQQADREITNASILNPQNVDNYVVKAQIFNSILGKTSEPLKAAQNALGAFSTAEQLDSNNAAIKMQIGSLHYAFEDYRTAAQYFLQATKVSPGFANAYYNLAFSLKNLEDYGNATVAMENVVQLLDPDSEDYDLASTELETLKKLRDDALEAQQQQQQGGQQQSEETPNPKEEPIVVDEITDEGVVPPEEQPVLTEPAAGLE